MRKTTVLILPLVIFWESVFASSPQLERNCKPLYDDLGWPDLGAWNALNSSISGRLLASIPPAAVCHSEKLGYDNASCSVLTAQWTNTSFHASIPISVDYNDETCLPDPGAPCSGDGYSRYVIVAQNAQDVQEGVKFAKLTGVRLVIKGTGHDYPGRSSGPDSLAIYTHHIRGLSIKQGDPNATAFGGIASFQVHAGEQMRSIYGFASKNNVTVMGGADMDIGIGGWISGGGHGPLTAKYGMGADQVLEMEVVTADGSLRTINAESEADLFWAMRGGGAGTFAVLISVTMKAYPAVKASELTFGYSTTPNSESFWSLVAYFHSQLPHLAESGVYGYYYVTPLNSNESNISLSGQVTGAWIGPSLDPSDMKDLVSPMEAHINASKWGDPVQTGSNATDKGVFMTWWSQNTPQTAGFSARLGSRLLSNSSLLGDFEKLKKALRISTPPKTTLLGHLVGPAPNTQRPTGGIAGGNDALLPAWRDTYSHVILKRTWTALNETQKREVTTDLRDVRVKALRDLSPETGAYMNEADPTEPDWQKTKFGENYPRLLQVKQKWDPTGVFWCKQCVGSELWDAEGNFGVENGVGQNLVKLCRS